MTGIFYHDFMQLDRNISADGKCKYALVKLRKVKALKSQEVAHALSVLENRGILDYASEGDSECFVIRLKDKYAAPTLAAYAMGAMDDDAQYAEEVLQLARKAAAHPNKKRPD